MQPVLKFFILSWIFSFLIIFISMAPIAILATPTSTNLEALGVNNQKNLPVEFFGSLRSDNDFTFYEFRLNAAEPLMLRKLTIYEEDANNAKEFDVSLDAFGQPMIEPAENNDSKKRGVLIDGNARLVTSETFYHEYGKKEWLFIVELTDKYILGAQYEFEEGAIDVRYLFSDKEIHAFWFVFYFGPLIAASILTALFIILRKTAFLPKK